MNTKHKIAVAVITNRRVRPKTMQSLADLISHTEHNVLPIVATEGYTIAENRSYCVFKAINEGCTHILFIDDDMTFPADTLEQMLSLEKEIVGVNSYSRKLPLTSTVGFIDENGDLAKTPEEIPEEPFTAYHIGMGVALIDMSVFSKIQKPWFRFETAQTGQTLNGEDGWFCDRARDAGYEIWVDPRLSIGHLGDMTF